MLQNFTKNKRFGAILTFTLLFLSSTAQAQVGIAKTAKETLRIGERYEIRLSSTDFSDFKIVTPKDGSLTLSLESFAEETKFVLYNEDGASFAPTKDIVSGQMSTSWSTDKEQICIWNSTVEKFKGNFTFKLDAGVYYLRMIRSQKGLSTANLSLQMKDLNGDAIR